MRRGGSRPTSRSCRGCCGRRKRAASGAGRALVSFREDIIAGRSQLRLTTLSLPTHREVVVAAFRISALGAPHLTEPPGSRAFPAACLHSTPPRSNESITDGQRITRVGGLFMSLSGTFVAATNLEGMCGLLQIDCCGEARDCCNAREHVVCGSENAGLHWLTAIRPRSRLRSHSCGPEAGGVGG